MIHYLYLLKLNCMKKLIIFFFLISIGVFSQEKLAIHLSIIKSQYKDSKYNLEQWVEEDGTISLSIKFSDAYGTYNFNKYQDSEVFTLTPVNNAALKKYIAIYDKKYKRLNSNKVQWTVTTLLAEDAAYVENIYLTEIDTNEGSFSALVWKFN